MPDRPKFMTVNILERAKRVRLMAFDVDGVLTDGGIYYGDGIELKRFHAQDGAGLSIAKRAGIRLCFITGRRSAAVARRAEELKIDYLHEGVENKIAVLEEIAAAEGLSREELCFMGDDILDLAVMAWVGLAIAPLNAVQDVKEVAHYVTLCAGGYGAVRDAIELVLRTQDRWDDLVKSFVEEKMGIPQ